MLTAFPSNPTEVFFFLVILILYMVVLLPFWMEVYQEISGRSRYSYQCRWPIPRCKSQCHNANSIGGGCPRFKERP